MTFRRLLLLTLLFVELAAVLAFTLGHLRLPRHELKCFTYGASSITAYRDSNGDVVVRVPVETTGQVCR
jgi:hypothetical protein